MSLVAKKLQAPTSCDWRGKLRLSLSLDASVRASFEVTQAGVLRLANGFEIDQQGVKRAPFLKSGGFGSVNVSRSLRRLRADEQKLEITKDEFIVLRELGRGATGTVELALHVPSLGLCALKATEIDDQEKRHQMAKELDALYNVCNISPKLVSFMGAYFQEGRVVFALEYMNRGSLQEIVETHGPLPESVIRSILRQVLEGLCAIHANKQMHRDIKPANILLNHFGEVKIADFGIIGTGDDQDILNTFCGTTMYMSPERLAGGSYTIAGDIWSLGLMLIVCATGKFPFVFDQSKGGYFGITCAIMDKPAPNINHTLYSENLKDFVNMCMLKDPFERWSADQLLQHPFIISSDVGASLDCWNSLLLASATRESQDYNDLRSLVQKATSPEFESDLDQLVANRHLVELIAEQMGLNDPLRFFPEFVNVPTSLNIPEETKDDLLNAATPQAQFSRNFEIYGNSPIKSPHSPPTHSIKRKSKQLPVPISLDELNRDLNLAPRIKYDHSANDESLSLSLESEALGSGHYYIEEKELLKQPESMSEALFPRSSSPLFSKLQAVPLITERNQAYSNPHVTFHLNDSHSLSIAHSNDKNFTEGRQNHFTPLTDSQAPTALLRIPAIQIESASVKPSPKQAAESKMPPVSLLKLPTSFRDDSTLPEVSFTPNVSKLNYNTRYVKPANAMNRPFSSFSVSQPAKKNETSGRPQSGAIGSVVIPSKTPIKTAAIEPNCRAGRSTPLVSTTPNTKKSLLVKSAKK